MELSNTTTSFFDKLITFNMFSAGRIEPEASDPDGYVSRAAKTQDALRVLALNFYNLVQTIRNDKQLSAEGIDKKIQSLAKETIGKIDKIYPNTLKVIEDRFNNLKNQFLLIDSKKDGDSIENVLREIEIRSHLLKVDESHRIKILEKTIEAKDELTFRAFINCPAFLNIVNSQLLTKSKEIWMKRINPALSDEFDKISEVLFILTGSFAETYHCVGEIGRLINQNQLYELRQLAATAMRADALKYEAKPNAILMSEKLQDISFAM